jgi:hypothetical protein
MKGLFGTVVLLAALVAAFAFSWRHGPLWEAQPAQAASAPVEPPAHRKAPQPARKTVPSSSSYTFGGYPCASSDCAEDAAGFHWAERNVIVDPDSCTGITAEFIEGCRVYVERHRRPSIPRTT